MPFRQKLIDPSFSDRHDREFGRHEESVCEDQRQDGPDPPRDA
jgi:hypothetical protein